MLKERLALMLVGQLERFSLRKARVWLAFFVIASTWDIQDKFPAILTPMYFPVFTRVRRLPWMA